MLRGGHLLAGAVLAGAMQRAWEAGDVLWAWGGSPGWRCPTVLGSRLRVEPMQSYHGWFLSVREQEVGDAG